ncbi:ubiquinone anaerobic biosynthesis accessory factor UbiT [Neptunicella sp.]|uniref:ubiquinone anaerobic biosynthesis accessory factor UbiT n=1 Tax=Neptunicella sp. TaxID=2125986 RepID=UPI003F692039
MIDIKRVNHKVVVGLPTFMRTINRYAPPLLQVHLLNLVFNQFFRAECRQGDLDFLNNKTLVIDVYDYQLAFGISLQQGRLKVCVSPTNEDLLIRASSVEFLAMINNSVDPDTLFFQRRLVMLGDTELGLYCKNLLDSIDNKRFPRLLSYGLDWLVQQQGSFKTEMRSNDCGQLQDIYGEVKR